MFIPKEINFNKENHNIEMQVLEGAAFTSHDGNIGITGGDFIPATLIAPDGSEVELHVTDDYLVIRSTDGEREYLHIRIRESKANVKPLPTKKNPRGSKAIAEIDYPNSHK